MLPAPRKKNQFAPELFLHSVTGEMRSPWTLPVVVCEEVRLHEIQERSVAVPGQFCNGADWCQLAFVLQKHRDPVMECPGSLRANLLSSFSGWELSLLLSFSGWELLF